MSNQPTSILANTMHQMPKRFTSHNFFSLAKKAGVNVTPSYSHQVRKFIADHCELVNGTRSVWIKRNANTIEQAPLFKEEKKAIDVIVNETYNDMPTIFTGSMMVKALKAKGVDEVIYDSGRWKAHVKGAFRVLNKKTYQKAIFDANSTKQTQKIDLKIELQSQMDKIQDTFDQISITNAIKLLKDNGYEVYKVETIKTKL